MTLVGHCLARTLLIQLDNLRHWTKQIRRNQTLETHTRPQRPCSWVVTDRGCSPAPSLAITTSPPRRPPILPTILLAVYLHQLAIADNENGILNSGNPNRDSIVETIPAGKRCIVCQKNYNFSSGVCRCFIWFSCKIFAKD